MRGFTTLNKQLLKETAYHLMIQKLNLLIFNMFYTKQYFWIKHLLEFREVTDFLW